MSRIDRLRQKMRDGGLDAALISKPENMRYLTAYVGEGCVLITDQKVCIITDFRYVEQAARNAPDAEIIKTSSELRAENAVHNCLQECGISTLALEMDYITADAYNRYKEILTGVDLQPLSGMPEQIRRVKDASEWAEMEKASVIACKAFDSLLTWIKPGMTEKQVQVELDYTMLKLGSECPAFDTIACAGVNGSLPHAIPSDYVIANGDLLTLDFGAQVNGYKCDMTRTIAFGTVSDELKKIYHTVLDAQLASLEAVKPGASCAAIDAIARDIIDRVYPGAFGHSLGHGVGLNVHEGPGFSQSSKDALTPGNVMTVEPGIYIPGLGGCRIEDMVYVTQDGYINAITAPKNLIVV